MPKRDSIAAIPPTTSPRTKAALAGLVFVACFLATFWLARRNADEASGDAVTEARAAVGARGPSAAPSFIPDAPPRPQTEAAAPVEDLAEEAVAALASEKEAREEALRAAIFGLADDPAVSIEARLDRYRGAIETALQDAGLENLVAYRGALIEAFLRNESVQAELSAMSPTDRQSRIDRIRAEFGYDEATVERMREIDARRDARWARGLEYMQARAELARTFDGDVLDEELRHLREDYFGHEAPTIEREEATGFFRYERPRVYGRN